MFKEVYVKYFARDKMLRHVFQHFEVAAVGFVVTYLIIKFPVNANDVILFILFSYLPDIDGFTSIFIWSGKIPVAKESLNLLIKFKFKDALSYATVHHKQLNRLILHNLIGYLIVWALFIFTVIGGFTTFTIIVASILTHLTFDLFDDIKQLGHINNWLWVLKK